MSAQEPEVHIEAPVRRWCDARAIPMPRRELSDEAALLIAAGHLQPAAQHRAVQRGDDDAARVALGRKVGLDDALGDLRERQALG